MIVANGISKFYGNQQVLKSIDFFIEKGDFISLIGPSGAGKTTLLNILSTLDNPDSGTLLFENESIYNWNANKLASFRNNSIGFIFQFHQLLPEFTVLENILLPKMIQLKSKNANTSKAIELAEILGFKDKMYSLPSQLSGGEQQRVAVARALINEPQIIFADEPSGNLDSKNAQALHELFCMLNQKYNQTIVYVTHNLDFAKMAKKQFKVQDGTLETIY